MADAAFLAPIEYCYLAFAVIIDFVIWALLLRRSTLIGVGLIARSRLLISLRERSFHQFLLGLTLSFPLIKSPACELKQGCL